MLMSHLVYNLNTQWVVSGLCVYLVLRLVFLSNRMFVSSDGTRYEWRRLYPEDPTAYDVDVSPRLLIAVFLIISPSFS